MRVCHNGVSRPVVRQFQTGFTMVELVATMVIIGILAFNALPRFSLISEFQATAFRDQVVAALRYGQKSAVSHRRLVCADVTPNGITLRIAASNPASDCGGATLNGPDGQTAYVSASSAMISGGVGTMYFQPSGTVTSSGGAIANFSVSINGAETVNVTGATGYVN